MDGYLYLRRGEGEQSATAIYSDDDGGGGTNFRISERLTPGHYTIEATSLRSGDIGKYDLRIGWSQ